MVLEDSRLKQGWTTTHDTGTFGNLRSVVHEPMTETVATSLGCSRAYTKASYAEFHGGRSPEDDGLKMESMTLPDGTQKEVAKARLASQLRCCWVSVGSSCVFLCSVLIERPYADWKVMLIISTRCNKINPN